MAKFIRCNSEITIYNGREVINNPINIDYVTYIAKTNESYYPDNNGVPAIYFGGLKRTWVYPKGKESLRDLDYERITKNQF